MLTTAPRGTKDIMPSDVNAWRYLEETMRKICAQYGYKEIRTPVFEHTELFQRGIGDTTDVVEKEMYTFTDRGNRSITLRPENTASAVRAYVEHKLSKDDAATKFYYIGPMFRYDRPQAGRLREFHQFGIEEYGTQDPVADVELISLASSVINRLQLDSVHLQINSIGCPTCRAEYHKALKSYFEGYKDKLCDTCLSRLDKNPMRILDCKSPICSEIAKDAPKITDYLCDECRNHFDAVQKYLDAAGIEYTVDPTIVRGLDYYTKTVFEFVTDCIGAQGTVCGGGRYDGLIEELGGKHLPSLGFAMGMERLLMVMDKQGIEIPDNDECMLYIATMGDAAKVKAFELIKQVRSCGMIAETDVIGRGLRAQMKYADKIDARYSIVLGDNEIEQNTAKVKNMETGDTAEVTLDGHFMERFVEIQLSDEQKNK